MRIIKHKTRRRTFRGFEDNGYLTVEGMCSVGTIEEAAELAMEVWAMELKAAPEALTLWERYG